MDRPRIGVFICQCGDAIGKYLDVPAIANYVKSLPYVEVAEKTIKACDEAGLQSIAETITELGLNRAVFGSCSPRTMESVFRATCEGAGLNPYALEVVNLRDHCALVHRNEPDRSTEKAKHLMRMAVHKAALLQPLERRSLEVVPSALVIGGGGSGIAAASSLGNRGFHVTLVEKEPTLGGLLRNEHTLWPTRDNGPAFIKERATLVEGHPNIDVLLGARVRAVSGHVGEYGVTIQQGEKEIALKVGAIVVATGAKEFVPTGLFGYDGRRVIIQGEFEPVLTQRMQGDGGPPRSVVMIQCVGARNEERPYCSRICCMTALSHAVRLKELSPSTQVYILYRDMLALGTVYEEAYREARGQGVIFVQYIPERPPVVSEGSVQVFDELLGETLNIPCDLVVLSTPLISQPDALELADLLKVPLGANGFYVEAHAKHRPLECDGDGVFLCGSAYFPADLGEGITQAYGAAARASILLGSESLEQEPTVASVDLRLCTACGLCESTCLYGAVAVTVVDERRGTLAARVDESLCRGCGACVAGCRSRAIDLPASTNQQVLAMIEAF